MNRPRQQSGFTLIEIMMTVSIIGLLAALSIPGMQQASTNSRAKRIGRELQNCGRAFVQYAFEHGTYPPDKTPTIIPAGMGPYLAKFPWAQDTVIGGQWDWDYQQFGITAGVSIKSPNWNDEQMLAVDRTIDDGNLTTGQFRKRPGGYIYILEE